MGWELLCPGGDHSTGAGVFRRHGTSGSGALQHAGGDQEVWGGINEDHVSWSLMDWLTCRWGRQGDEIMIAESW
jgi:hypothetical protein